MAEKETNTTTEETVVETETLSELDLLKTELEKTKAQVDDYKDKWMRNVAEFDNYKKRNATLYANAFFEGKADVLLKVLPIGDNLDMAIAMGLDEKTTEGLKLLKRKFDDTLASMEVTEINPVGEQFDPQVAEAVMQAEGEDGEQSDTVKQVFQKGYKIKDKIIRYAKVSVIK
jgi:molecular chaperone GrpE